MYKEKQIQIPTKAFIDLYKLIRALNNYELDYNTLEIVKSLETVVEGKLEAMEKRKAFTEYKTSNLNTEDRENKRKKYLELAGINQNWVSQNEILP